MTYDKSSFPGYQTSEYSLHAVSLVGLFVSSTAYYSSALPLFPLHCCSPSFLCRQLFLLSALLLILYCSLASLSVAIMRFSSTLAVSLAATLSIASPIELEKRVSTPKVNDGIILNYALTLEYLERAFYRGALANFTHEDFVNAGFEDPFYANLQEIYFDEQTHVSFLSGALTAAKVTPTVELQYSFPYTDVSSFITLSSVLEGVGVSAYLGAAASIMNKDYLTAAGSILTVEARHTSYIRASLGESPFPNPFDTPLDFNEVYSLAAPFITGGSSPVTLPFEAFPALTLQCTQYYYEWAAQPDLMKAYLTTSL